MACAEFLRNVLFLITYAYCLSGKSGGVDNEKLHSGAFWRSLKKQMDRSVLSAGSKNHYGRFLWCRSSGPLEWSGLLSPAKFIPVLEETGRITELDLYVLEQICQDYQMISQRGCRVVPVSVNLSRKDLLHDDIIERIEAIMARYNVPRELINVEITESAIISRSALRQRVADRRHW